MYAVGRVEARFPDLGVEKELEQAVGRTDTRGMTDGQAVHTVLNEPANRYLARQMCWVLTIGASTPISSSRGTAPRWTCSWRPSARRPGPGTSTW
ncbi:hypothetical protein ACFQ60_13740 [Streptomyces zhihengii]